MAEEIIYDDLQEQIVNKLRQSDKLGSFNILHEELHDLINEINLDLNKLGLVIIVASPSENCSNIGYPEPMWDEIAVQVSVVEDVAINRSATGTGRTAKSIAKDVIAALWHFRPQGYDSVLYPAKPAVALSENKDYLIYRANMKLGE